MNNNKMGFRSVSLVSFALLAAASPLRRQGLATVYESCVLPNTIAITFDDGPYIYNKMISDAFTNAGAKTTFFFNGNNYDCIYSSDSISRVQYVYNAGHQVASHTWSHGDLTSASNAQIDDAMYRMDLAFSRIIGVLPAFMRPPFGDYNNNVRSVAAGRGESLVLWDWDTGDADGNTTAQSEAVYNDIVNSGASNALILNHETEQTTANTLVPYAINLFQSNGYSLVSLAECLGVQPYQVVGVPQSQTSAWTCDGTPDPGAFCSGSQCLSGTVTVNGGGGSGGGGGGGGGGSTGTGKTIRPGKSNSLCLTASNADNAAVTVTTCNGGSSQQWTQSGGTLTIYGNKCLDVPSGNTTPGTKMQIYTCFAGNTNQQMTVTTDNRIAWTNHGECLDLTDGSTSSGTLIQMWTCTNGNTNQVWNFV